MRASRPLKSAGLVVYRGRPSAIAVAAIIRSIFPPRGLRPAAMTAAVTRPGDGADRLAAERLPAFVKRVQQHLACDQLDLAAAEQLGLHLPVYAVLGHGQAVHHGASRPAGLTGSRSSPGPVDDGYENANDEDRHPPAAGEGEGR